MNGAQDGTGASAGSLCSNTGHTLEGDAVDGIVDELQISNVARSADWIAAQYNNQSAPGSFYAVGSEAGVTSTSFTASPIAVPTSNAASIVISLSGVGTTWSAETFTISGVSGVTKISQNISSGTAATVLITTSTTSGTLTISDGTISTTIAVGLSGSGGGIHAYVGQ